MRILYIALGYKPVRTSGLDIASERLVQVLADNGHSVTVVAVQGDQVSVSSPNPGLTIYRYPMGKINWISYSYLAAKAVKALQDQQSFDVVHFSDIHFAYPYQGNFVAYVWQSFRQRRTSRNSPFRYFMYCWLAEHFMERPSIRKAKGLLAGSVATRDEFLHHYQVPEQRITLTRPGIDTDLFKHRLSNDSIRARLGIRKDDPVILFAGFVTPRKGLEYLARALPLMKPLPKLVILGRWNKEYRYRFIEELGSYSNRLIEAGYIPDEEMPDYLSMADIVVTPTLLEGFGLPLAEALGCETPVVASDVGSVAEVVGPGGLLVPARDPQALSQAVSELLMNTEKRRQLGKLGRRHVEEQFSLQTMYQSVIKAYELFSPLD
ncbi:MAG: glycosyltransferase family 4 protein [Anaerolineaceae bacterium]|nr:glycosyltransferase family 4 protein [Anaerolineaceae bacterium]